MIIPFIFIIGLALFFEAFFSGSETIFISSNVMRLIHLKEQGRRRARRAYELLKRPDRLLATTLVGTNLSVVISSSCATFLCTHLFKEHGSLIAMVVMTPLVLIFGEIIPKITGRQYANKLVLFVAYPLSFFQKIFAPAVDLVSFIGRLVIRLLRVEGAQKNPFITKDEIKALIAEIAREGILKQHEEETLNKVFQFTLTKAGDIMTPLQRLISIDDTETVEQIKEKSRTHGFTRFPVFKDKQLAGFINIFEIFYVDTEWQKLVRPIRQIDVNVRIEELFSHMKANKESLVAATREGKLVGIVTIEDVMEEVICKICK